MTRPCTSPSPAPADGPPCAAARAGPAWPTSATPGALVAAGAVSLLLGVWLVFGLRVLGPLDTPAAATWATALLVGLLGVGMTGFDLLRLRSWRANLRPPVAEPMRARGARVLRKWLGLHLVLALLALAYGVLAEYRGALYQPFFTLCQALLPWFSLAALPYIAWVDARMADPHDPYWALGEALLRRRRPGLDRATWLHFALGWLVKGFFLPLMLGYATGQVQALDQLQVSGAGTGAAAGPAFRPWFELGFTLLYFIDVVWGCVGYLWSLRLTDSHVRSAQPAAGGWAVALACYEPLSKGLWPAYFAYGSHKAWGVWIGDSPALYTAWGCGILALLAVYTASTMAFGLRFSNLTHRGIITHGPYRWLRHPAYVSKNLSWWLIAMPFMVDTSLVDSLRLCAMLLLVNGLYALRARTEEQHLRSDPVYAAYLAAMAARRARLWAALRRAGQAGAQTVGLLRPDRWVGTPGAGSAPSRQGH